MGASGVSQRRALARSRTIAWGSVADTANRALLPRSAPCANQLLRALACLLHALHDRLGIRFRLALPPLVVVASQRRFDHGLHSVAGGQADQGQQSGGQPDGHVSSGTNLNG